MLNQRLFLLQRNDKLLELPFLPMIYEGSRSYCKVENFVNLQSSANVHGGTFRKLCHIACHVYIYVDITFYKDKILA